VNKENSKHDGTTGTTDFCIKLQKNLEKRRQWFYNRAQSRVKALAQGIALRCMADLKSQISEIAIEVARTFC